MNSVQTNGYNKDVLHSNIQKLRKAQKIHHLTDANFNDSIQIRPLSDCSAKA